MYRRQLPDDPGLHRLAREREFIEQIDRFGETPLRIPDEAVDIEANLKPDILRAALYRLGLDPHQFEDIYRDIGMLVGLRNNIAHGATKQGIDDQIYETYEEAALRVMEKIANDIMEAIENRVYLLRP